MHTSILRIFDHGGSFAQRLEAHVLLVGVGVGVGRARWCDRPLLAVLVDLGVHHVHQVTAVHVVEAGGRGAEYRSQPLLPQLPFLFLHLTRCFL